MPWKAHSQTEAAPRGLRHNKKPKMNITRGKDRGKDVESALGFPAFKGERINEHHLTLAEKRRVKELRQQA